MASAGGAASVRAHAGEAPAQRPFLSDNAMWEAFGGRPVGRIVYGGAEMGECRAAVEAVGSGGVDQWYDVWTAMADRLAR